MKRNSTTSLVRTLQNQLRDAKRESEMRHHAFNLYLNDAIEWFAERTTSDGTNHQFGIGIVRGIPEDQQEDLAIIFTLSKRPDPQFAPDLFHHMTVQDIHSFKTIAPGVMSRSDDCLGREFGRIISEVGELVDEAHAEYLRGRIRPIIIT